MAMVTRRDSTDFIRRTSDSFYVQDKANDDCFISSSTKTDTETKVEMRTSDISALTEQTKALLTEFGTSTSIHGLRHVAESGTPIKRTLWFTLVLVCFGVLVYQIVDRMVYYYSWPITVNVKINYNKTLEFPAVTICNQNSFKASTANKFGRYRIIESMFSPEGPLNTSYIFDYGGNITLDDLYLNASHQKEDLIFECIWKGNLCGPEDFVVSLTDHGVCYTFTKDRDDLLVSSPGKPKVCSISEYYSCLQALIDTFQSDADDLCDCPIPCSLVGYETDTSYASISENAINKYLNNNNIQELKQKLIDANEVTSRMDTSKLEGLYELAIDFEKKLDEIKFIFLDKLEHLVHQISNDLENETNRMSWVCDWKTFVFDFQYYVVDKNFVRFRDAMEERHAHVVALDFAEFLLTLEREIKSLIDMDASQLSTRQYVYFNVLNIINNRKEIIQRTIGNYSVLIDAYKSGIQIFNYMYGNTPRDENQYVVPKDLLHECLYQNNRTTESVKLYVDHLREAVSLLEQFQSSADEAFYQSSSNVTLLALRQDKLNTVIVDWLSARQTVYYNVIDKPLRVLSQRKKEFESLCFSYKQLALSLTKTIEALDRKIEAVKESLFVPLDNMHDLIHAYTFDGIGSKYDIAQNFTSGVILTGKANLDKLMYELLTADSDMTRAFTDIQFLTTDIFKSIVRDYDSFMYYTFTGNLKFVQTVSEITIQIESNFTTYMETIRFYDTVGQDGLNFGKAVVDIVTYFEKYLASLETDQSFIRNNFAQLDIFYRQMNYEEITQQVAFDTFSLFCDIGGSMGLFLGASILSLCELFDLLWINIYKSKNTFKQKTIVVEPLEPGNAK